MKYTLTFSKYEITGLSLALDIAARGIKNFIEPYETPLAMNRLLMAKLLPYIRKIISEDDHSFPSNQDKFFSDPDVISAMNDLNITREELI